MRSGSETSVVESVEEESGVPSRLGFLDVFLVIMFRARPLSREEPLGDEDVVTFRACAGRPLSREEPLGDDDEAVLSLMTGLIPLGMRWVGVRGF